MTQVLLVVDVQNDYFPGGKMVLKETERALAATIKMVTGFKERHLPIIYIQHIKESPHADFFARGTSGARLHKDLGVPTDALIVKKHYPNSFIGTNLGALLKELEAKQVVITGMMTHMCIDSTTRASSELGLQPVLISDATATRDLVFDGRVVPADQVSDSFLAALANFAQVISAEDFLEANA